MTDINSGLLVYHPAMNNHGLAAGVFTFQVQDDDGTANGGQDTDQTPNTMTIDITSVNDAPVGTGNTVTATEDIPFVFSLTDFGFTDPDDTIAPNNFQGVVITTLPVNGTLTLLGVPVVAGQTVVLADIPNLEFLNALNDNGVAYDSFRFQVVDDGGTANGGVDTDITPRTMTIDVTAVDDPPVLDVNAGMADRKSVV